MKKKEKKNKIIFSQRSPQREDSDDDETKIILSLPLSREVHTHKHYQNTLSDQAV